MQIKGLIVDMLPEVGGTSQSGNQWRKREYVLDTQGDYPKKIAFSAMNDRIDQLNIQPGQVYTVDVDVESREYNGKWYTTLWAWRATQEIFS